MTKRVSQIDDYYKVRIESASPMGLIYMIYERAMKTLTDSRVLLKKRKRRQYCEAIVHAQDCIRELRSSLNLEVGDIAHSLYRLYEFMINQLVEANITKENPLYYINQVEKMLNDLYSTWKQAEKRMHTENTKAHTKANPYANADKKDYQPLSITG